MNAGIPHDPGIYLLANINDQGQVTFSPSQQSQGPNDISTTDVQAAVSESHQQGSSSSSSSPAIDAMSTSTLQGNGSPTPSHLPVVAPPATQLSPSAPYSLSNVETQVPPLLASLASAPGSSSPTALASSSPATSGLLITSNVSPTSAPQTSVSAQLPALSSSKTLSTTATLAPFTSVTSVSGLPTTITISSQAKTPSPVPSPKSSSAATASVISSAQAQTSKSSSSSNVITTPATTVSSKTSPTTLTSSTTLQTSKGTVTVSSSSSTAVTQTKTATTTSSSTAPTTSALLVESKPTSSPASSSSLSQSPSSSSVAPSSTPAAIQSSNLNVHDTSFYVGIALGTIAAVAFVLVLLAWCIRFRRHEKRRRLQNTVVPWATEGGDEEQGSVRPSRVSPSLENIAHMRNWEPRGDRDVGEPRRVYGGPDRSVYSLQNSSIPGYNATSDESLASSIGSTAPLRPRNTLRQLPSHMVDAELAARGHGGDYFRRFHGSREPHLNPYIGNQSSDASGAPVESAQRNLVDRLRKVGKTQTSDALPEWDRLPTPGKDQPTQDFEPWAASIRASLANALNTIAYGLNTSGNQDRLTTAPSRQNLQARRNSASSSDDESKAWTLEEKRDGAGVVHFLPPLDKGGVKKPSPGRRPTLSFADGESISTYDDSASSVRTVSTREPRIPLVASSAPEKVMVREEPQLNDLRKPSLSRESSVYSTLSAGSTSTVGKRSAGGGPVYRLPRIPSVLKEFTDEGESVVIRP